MQVRRPVAIFMQLTKMPNGLTNVVAIAAGYFHSVALKADGTVVAWGDNGQRQLNMPEGLTNVVSIAAGGYQRGGGGGCAGVGGSSWRREHFGVLAGLGQRLRAAIHQRPAR